MIVLNINSCFVTKRERRMKGLWWTCMTEADVPTHTISARCHHISWYLIWNHLSGFSFYLTLANSLEHLFPWNGCLGSSSLLPELQNIQRPKPRGNTSYFPNWNFSWNHSILDDFWAGLLIPFIKHRSLIILLFIMTWN